MTTPPDPPNPEHKRRPRYRGTHPRRFEERYKELAHEKYPDIVPHILAKGRTPAGQHVPIMVEEVLAALAPAAGERAADCTLGYGGHARRILERITPGGMLVGLDADPIELPRTEARLRAAGHGEDVFVVRRSNFAGLHAVLQGMGWSDGVDVVLADLGVSSMQIDDPARGFTFGADGPLDMRMNPQRGEPASAYLARIDVATLAEALTDNADEPHADAIAAALDVRRGHLRTTTDLAEEVRRVVGGIASADVDDSVRRVFQAVRIEVNDEFGALDAFLRDLPRALAPGGRVAVLTFHSGEDRRVKQAFKAGRREGVWSAIAEEVIRPSPEEQRSNPRSSSAKLRWAVRA